MVETDVKTAITYLRYSGESQSEEANRQRRAIEKFARTAQYEIIAEFVDGETDDFGRPDAPGFASMLKGVEARGIQTIIVATAGSLSEDTTVQAVAFLKLRRYGIDLVAADAPGAFITDARGGEYIDRVISIAADFEIAVKTAHLRAVGERARIKAGPKHRKRYAELHPEVVLIVKRMHQAAVKKGERLSLRKISAKLAEAGHLKDGKPFHPDVINRMIRGPRPGHPK
jgi:DNA invertase Pin-like site-specific DNA recombinase